MYPFLPDVCMEWFALCGNPYPPERDRGLVDYQRQIRCCFRLCGLPSAPFSQSNHSVQNTYDQSKANRRLLATATQVFASPHSYGCAGQCFGGVLSGSIFESTKGLGPQIASLFQGPLFPLTFQGHGALPHGSLWCKSPVCPILRRWRFSLSMCRARSYWLI